MDNCIVAVNQLIGQAYKDILQEKSAALSRVVALSMCFFCAFLHFFRHGNFSDYFFIH